MVRTIKANYIYKINVYYSVPADNAFGEDFVDVVDKFIACDDEEDANRMLRYYCNVFKNKKGYCVRIIPMEENVNHEGFVKIK